MGERDSIPTTATARPGGSKHWVTAGPGRVAASVILAALGAAPPALAQTWNLNANGTWGTAGNWTPVGVPNAVDASATLGPIIASPRTITLAAPATVGTLSFTATRSYTVSSSAAANTLTFDVSSGSASLVDTATAIQTINSNIVLNDPLAVSNTGTATLTLNGAISGTGSLTKSGASTVILNADNTYSGGTTISSGTLQLGVGGGTGSVTGNITNNGRLVFSNGLDPTYAGIISGTGGVTQDGGDTVFLTGANTYSGDTTITAGVLSVGNGGTTGTIGSGNTTVSGALTFDRSDAFAYDGTIANAGDVTNHGSGTLTLGESCRVSGDS